MSTYFRYSIEFERDGKILNDGKEYFAMANDLIKIAQKEYCVDSEICQMDDNTNFVYIDFTNKSSYMFLDTFSRKYSDLIVISNVMITEGTGWFDAYLLKFKNGKQLECTLVRQ